MRKFYWLTIVSVFLFSCQEEGESPADSFDRKSMLENIGEYIIEHGYDTFAEGTNSLWQQAQAFVNNPTKDNLVTLQNYWKAASLRWQAVEMFDLGPVEEMSVKTSISKWPTNTFAIEDAMESGTEINAAYIESLGSTSKGLPAIEYLLFDAEQGNGAILSQFQDQENRKAYLLALCENLNSIATEIEEAWEPSGDNYMATFINASGKEVGSSTLALANNLIMLAEIVKNEKIGIPLGKQSMGSVLPKNLEAWRSGVSLSLIKENIESIEQVFAGESESGGDLGFDDYLDQANARYEGRPLSEVIKEQIDNIEEAADAIDVPLQEALVSEKDKVETLYSETQKLVILLKTDMMSSLGLLVTFSDNDGD